MRACSAGHSLGAARYRCCSAGELWGSSRLCSTSIPWSQAEVLLFVPLAVSKFFWGFDFRAALFRGGDPKGHAEGCAAWRWLTYPEMNSLAEVFSVKLQVEQMIGLPVNSQKTTLSTSANAFQYLTDLVCQAAHVSKGKLNHLLISPQPLWS